jgi:hypothetical protein
VVLHIE